MAGTPSLTNSENSFWLLILPLLFPAKIRGHKIYYNKYHIHTYISYSFYHTVSHIQGCLGGRIQRQRAILQFKIENHISYAHLWAISSLSPFDMAKPTINLEQTFWCFPTGTEMGHRSIQAEINGLWKLILPYSSGQSWRLLEIYSFAHLSPKAVGL